MPTIRWLAGPLAALACAIAACGVDERPVPGSAAERATSTPAPASASPPPTLPGPEATEDAPTEVDPADVGIVRAWADSLRRGDVRAAARYFALPSLVSNGTAPIRLRTLEEAEFFNRTLPCGARVIGAEPAPHGFLIVTFRLTERPGEGECGTGTGETARTAFRIRDDHITDWLRVQDVESAPETLS